jgi:hypothetical protein
MKIIEAELASNKYEAYDDNIAAYLIDDDSEDEEETKESDSDPQI